MAHWTCPGKAVGGQEIREGILTIIGVGLLGGSVGLAARRKGLFAEVRGTTAHSSTLDAALRLGAIDRGFASTAEAARDADMVVVATAVSTIPAFAIEAASSAREGALITDVGSVKASIAAAVRPHMPPGRTFIGSHPMAGSEKRGVEHARADLLAGATCIITPNPDSPGGAAVERLSDFWRSLGMNVFSMSPAAHDAVVASVSHLPHLVAAALIGSVPDGALPFAATGLRDTTRIAGGDAALWRDIIEANWSEVVRAIDHFEGAWGDLRRIILQKDYVGLEAYFQAAARRRSARYDDTEDGGTL